MLQISESKEYLLSFAERKQYRTLMSAKIMKIFHFLPNILVFLLYLCFFTSSDAQTIWRFSQSQ